MLICEMRILREDGTVVVVSRLDAIKSLRFIVSPSADGIVDDSTGVMLAGFKYEPRVRERRASGMESGE